ncbi:MAG: CvpA family protein [Flavobacteriales bacterium]|nr:CvpA family protein [Flavobacteriales bacterium]
MPNHGMNWLDIVLFLVLAGAAWKGFRRGFLIELASLLGLVLGIWVGVHFSDRVTAALDLEVKHAAVAFLITFVLVLLLVLLLGHLLTKLMDIAQLSLPNKVAGIAFGVLRSAFALSIALNLLLGFSDGAFPPEQVRKGSSLFSPMRSFAPMVVPQLEETKWLKQVKQAAEELMLEVDERGR